MTRSAIRTSVYLQEIASPFCAPLPFVVQNRYTDTEVVWEVPNHFYVGPDLKVRGRHILKRMLIGHLRNSQSTFA